MTQARTRLTTDIDYARKGKQLGFLRLVHSDDRYAFGILPIPLAVIANGDGPTMLLTAGTHGDEYEGQILLQDLIRNLDPARITGRLIVLPALNFPAATAPFPARPMAGPPRRSRIICPASCCR